MWSPSGYDLSQQDGGTEPDETAYLLAIIVLLTDGANTRGPDPLDVAGMAADRQFRVYTIGFGTTEYSEMVCTRQQLGSDVFNEGFGGFGSFVGGGASGVFCSLMKDATGCCRPHRRRLFPGRERKPTLQPLPRSDHPDRSTRENPVNQCLVFGDRRHLDISSRYAILALETLPLSLVVSWCLFLAISPGVGHVRPDR